MAFYSLAIVHFNNDWGCLDKRGRVSHRVNPGQSDNHFKCGHCQSADPKHCDKRCHRVSDGANAQIDVSWKERIQTMPTVHVQQLHCATYRQDVDGFLQRTCRCRHLPSLTTRVSKLTLHDTNLAFSSKGFSAIVKPSASPLSKSTRVSYTKESSKTTSSRIARNAPSEKSFHEVRSPTPPKRVVSPSRNSRVTPASRYKNAFSLLNNIQPKTTQPSNESIITKKLANVSTPSVNVHYDKFSRVKEELQKRSTISNTNFHKYEYSQPLKNDVDNNTEYKNSVTKDKTCSKNIQLLHPGWRRVPWKPHFGWTDSHQQLCKLLRQEIKKGSVDSIYYSSEEEHAAARSCWRALQDSPFLGGPSVTAVSDILEVIRRISAVRAPWLYAGRVARWSRRTASELSDYDADDED